MICLSRIARQAMTSRVGRHRETSLRSRFEPVRIQCADMIRSAEVDQSAVEFEQCRSRNRRTVPSHGEQSGRTQVADRPVMADITFSTSMVAA